MFALHKDFNSQAKTDDRFIKQEMKSRKDLIVFVRSYITVYLLIEQKSRKSI